MDEIQRRKTVKPKNSPNPLFEQWLEEWRLEAANKNSELQYCYKNVSTFILKYVMIFISLVF